MKEAIDTFGRKHQYLRISLTDRCNLRCLYCMPEQGIQLMAKPHLMSDEEVLGIARIFVGLGVNTIRLTGGEPLVRKDFGPLVQGLADMGVKLKLTTNGILLDQYFDVLEQAGLKHLNISIDSLDKARAVFMTKRDYFDRINQNIQEALRRDFLVKLNVVVLRGMNDEEIPAFLKLTENQHIVVKFIEFMPFKDNRWEQGMGLCKEEILRMAESVGRVERLADPAHSTSSNFRIEGFEGSFGIVSTVTEPFCGSCNRIRLTADGKMKNCLFSRGEADILGAYRRGEDVEALILSTLLQKKFSRDGMSEFTPDEFEQNRTMIAIGG